MTDLATLPDKLFDYGIGAVVLFIVAKAVLVPVVRAMLRQFEHGQKAITEALTLLRSSVQTSQRAVSHFVEFEKREDDVHERLLQTQAKMLDSQNRLFDTQREMVQSLNALNESQQRLLEQIQKLTEKRP